MELINPSVKIWNQDPTIEDMWDHIAKCTLVCRQAESIKAGETSEEFCWRTLLAKRPFNHEGNHLAMLEHGSVYLQILLSETTDEKILFYQNNKYTKVHLETEHDIAFISTNLRVLVENDLLLDLNYWSKFTKFHTKRVTVNFITNIGVSREFNRHRVNSIVEESTRYCNYSKDKFNNSLNIVLPQWLFYTEEYNYVLKHQNNPLAKYLEDINNNEDDELLEKYSDVDFYLAAITFAEYFYMMLIKKGWTAQKAREVLPLATKTQLIHTAFIDDWKHFILLRSWGISGAPHPNAKLIADKLYSLFIKEDLLL